MRRWWGEEGARTGPERHRPEISSTIQDIADAKSELQACLKHRRVQCLRQVHGARGSRELHVSSLGEVVSHLLHCDLEPCHCGTHGGGQLPVLLHQNDHTQLAFGGGDSGKLHDEPIHLRLQDRVTHAFCQRAQD